MRHGQNNIDTKFLYGSLPALPVILSGIIMVWQSGATLYGVVISLLLVLCGIGSGLFLWYRHVNQLTQINSRWEQDEIGKIDTVATYTTELERLLLTISPILSQHVMVSREHTEQEIISLTSRFADMVGELQLIVDSADNTLDGQHYHLDNVITTSRELLQPVLEVLKQAHKADHDVLGELQKLSGHMSGLNAMSTEIHNLTERIDRLALSAANEASLAGGFEVVESDARKLADDFLHIDQRLGNRVNDMIAAVTAALKIAENAAQVDDSTLFQAEANIEQALSHLSLALAHYRDNAGTLRNNAEQIRGEINNVLVALQFQDRVSQILMQVENNLLNLQKTIEKIQEQGSNRDGNMLRVDEAVEHIEENYKSVSSRPDHAPDSSDELTFF
ncbi:methyl-accepting chemotaxis protein [Methylobacter tundripaludum]|uniref:methyl-accepting chemotaxis protein n=1 Tax=Methylobacter tundripaludum TaxID=173365 RepID=UPI000480539C|nr:methyl-accepting chemotaxis protein [Methylobacter tundripaludum]